MHAYRPKRTARTLARRTVAALLLSGAGVLTTAPAASAATCSDLDFVDARGTGEPGTLGLIVGDPLYSALKSHISGKTISSYAVDYPASVDPNSASQGNADLVQHVKDQAAACPNQKFILGGYSQGANVVDNSIGISSEGAVVGGKIVATIPDAIEPRVAAVLLFGNPIRAVGRSVTGTYQARTKDYCANGDPICQPGGTDITAHLSYTQNVDDAATFAAGHV